MTTTPPPQKPILISGAGLASLLLAQSLLRSHIPFRIYERDASLLSRGQGYRLRLSDLGLDAIESVLSPAAFQRFYDRCGKTGGGGMGSINAITNELIEQQTATVGQSLGSREGKVVGISRGDMRAAFLEGCEEYIQWNKHVTGYELLPSGDGVRALFADGTTSIGGSLLVGGEGIKSSVAKQVSNGALKVFDLGARGIHGQAPTTAFKDLGEGVFRLVDDQQPHGRRLAVITNVRPGELDDASMQFGWTMIGAPGVVQAPNDDYTIIGATAAGIAKSLTANWHPRFRPLFENMVEHEAAFWKITCSTPGGVPEWPNEPRVTVIGDAAHSMTPAGGIGANTAVRDSALLGRLLGEAGGWTEGVTDEYEREMRVYAGEAVAQSYGMATKSFGVNEVCKSSATV